eukprot:09062.XXX_543564_543704_1 [CDS] Oithona nana genome sequencing.
MCNVLNVHLVPSMLSLRGISILRVRRGYGNKPRVFHYVEVTGIFVF